MREYLDKAEFSNPYAITLTFKKVFDGPNGKIWITPELCRQNLRHYINVRQREVFRRGELRRGTAYFKMVAVLERDTSGRFHYHLLMDLPGFRDRARFAANIWFTWPLTDWGYKQVDVKPVTNLPGWVRYITKNESGEMECGLDLFNTRL